QFREDVFAGGSRWLQIGAALRDKARTQAECARALGVPSGTIHRQLRDMLDAKLVIADTAVPGHGTRYRLNPSMLDALDRATVDRQPPGRITAGQPLLVVSSESLHAIAGALESEDLGSVVVWTA